MSSWNLRDQFSDAIDQWYLILGFITLGALISWGISMVFPSPYRASADLYVGIDITRVNEMEYLIPMAKEEPLNLDDYKNWQLKQLTDIFYSDQVLELALSRLTEEDPAWAEVEVSDFKENIDIYWFDTGIWRLEYQGRDRQQAVEAVQAWLDAGHDYVSGLLAISARVAELDAALEINKDAASQLKLQTVRLEGFLESSAEWQELFGNGAGSAPLSAEERQEFNSWLLLYREDPDTWQVPLSGYPGAGEPANEYAAWLALASQNAQVALEELELQLDILARYREEILPEYHQSLDDSLGLSANIVLRENSATPVVEQIRHPGTSSLAGTGLGLLAWLIFVVIKFRGPREDQV